MKKVVGSLYTNKHTVVFHENPEDMYYGAPHHFAVLDSAGSTYSTDQKDIEIGDIDTNDIEVLAVINFQQGPVNEVGVNGVFDPDVIAMVLERMKAFQAGRFKCKENEIVIQKLEEALMYLRKRTDDRAARGVLGTTNT